MPQLRRRPQPKIREEVNKICLHIRIIALSLFGLWISSSVSCAEQPKATTDTKSKLATPLDQTDCETVFQNATLIDGKTPEFPKLQIQMFGDMGPVKIWEDLDLFNNGNAVVLISHELPLRNQEGDDAKNLFLNWLYVVHDQELLPTETDLLNFHRSLTSLMLSQKEPENPKNAASDVLYFTNFPYSIQLLDKAGNFVNDPISQFSDDNNPSREDFDLPKHLRHESFLDNTDVVDQASSKTLKGAYFAKIGFVEFESTNLLELKLFSPTDFSYDQFKNTYVLLLKLELSLKSKEQKIAARIVCAQNGSETG